MLITLKEKNLPLDEVIFCDIRFNKEISGEHPLMAEWIPKAEKIIKDKFGIKVIHLTADKNFSEWFYSKKTRGRFVGSYYGFPMSLQAWCNDRLKMRPINNYICGLLQQYNVVEYIGIAKDEPLRLERYKEMSTPEHKYITLADLGLTEQEALTKCKTYNLLSPKYKQSFRGGCWFCPKMPVWEIYTLWRDYPDYYNKLVEMEKDSPVPFKPDGKTLAERRENFIKGKIPKRRK